MGDLLAVVAPQLPGGDPCLGQQIIQQHARPRATLAVHVSHIVACQVGEALDAFGIPARDDQPLFTAGQRHHDHRRMRKIAPDVREVVLAGLRVQQMGAGEVRFTPAQCEQPAEAAGVRASQPPGRLPFREKLGYQIECQIMATDC